MKTKQNKKKVVESINFIFLINIEYNNKRCLAIMRIIDEVSLGDK